GVMPNGPQRVSTPRAAASGTGPDWFRRMDRNRDGDVSRREFLGPREQFDRIDRDRDGLIDPDEAAAVGRGGTVPAGDARPRSGVVPSGTQIERVSSVPLSPRGRGENDSPAAGASIEQARGQGTWRLSRNSRRSARKTISTSFSLMASSSAGTATG